MPASSNFNQAIREAQTSSIVGPNVVQKALPYVGGGMVLTSLGVLAGVSLIATNKTVPNPAIINSSPEPPKTPGAKNPPINWTNIAISSPINPRPTTPLSA